MTHQDRPTLDGATETVSRLAAHPVFLAAPSTPLPGDYSLPWEDLYHRASPEQRRQLLQVSQQQGLLHAEQLGDLIATALQPTLPMLLQGSLDALRPVIAGPLEPRDVLLDATQREAVSQALATPDVCLIQGLPGTGKSRVAAEIVHQAVARGQRLLVLAPSSAAVDRLLELVVAADSVCALRCVGTEENLTTLSPLLRSFTLADRQRAFEEQTIGSARAAATALQQQLERQSQDLPLWSRLEQLAVQGHTLSEQHQQLTRDRGELPRLIEEEARLQSPQPPHSPLQARLLELQQTQTEILTQLDARLAAGKADAEKARAELAEVVEELARLQPPAEARRQNRWWAPAYWQGLFQGDLLSRVDALVQRETALQEASASAGRNASALEEEGQKTEQQHKAERAQVVQNELENRLAEIDARLAELAHQQQTLQAAADQLIAQFSPGTEVSRDLTPAAVAAGRQRWLAQRTAWEQQQIQQRQWLVSVEQTGKEFSQQLQQRVNVVAGSLTALAADPLFGDKAPGVLFDFLLLDEADQITEADFLALSRRTRRWILLGSPAPETEECEPVERKSVPSRHAGQSPLRPQPAQERPAGLRASLFAQLWRQLHTDPRRLPYAWLLRDGRLCCRLHTVPPEQERWIQREHVADRPDIELRILSAPRVAPLLVEVLFPTAMGIHEAKAYLFTELEELTIQGQAPSLRWLERPGQVVLRLANAELPDAQPVLLDRGVSELVGALALTPAGATNGPAPWQTCCVEFDCSAGWDRARAEQWIEKRLKLRNLGRTILLNTPHRMRGGLAHWVSEVALAGAYSCPGLADGEQPAVDFVAVPGQAATVETRRNGEGESRRRGGSSAAVATRPRSLRGGAGLEVDLADSRRIDALPTDLRVLLPAQGLVNYLEAQAVVRTVESLAADPAFATAVGRWQQSLSGCLPARHPAVAVIALYPAQVDLIRRLIRRLPHLSSAAVSIEVGLPEAFRQRECHTALLSLTRSHTHRAVTYGESPEALQLALTRPACRLIVFGDSGTLLRRSQWPGAVDHLDEPCASRERQLISRLVRAIQGEGAVSHVFRLHEGGCL
jgi:AAA domain